MPSTNLYFNNYSFTGEQRLIEDLIIEAIKIYGVECFYLPRTFVNSDDVWGEDASSKFENAYPLEMYIKNVDSFEGEGDFLSKFGLEIRDSVTLTISQRRFGEELSPEDTTSDAGRPVEGDLIWFPLNGKIFEVKHVEHEAIFYQLGSLQTYDLRCELFEYSSEIIDTGVKVIDEVAEKFSIDELIYQILFETYTDTAFATATVTDGTISDITIDYPGENFTEAPTVTIESPVGEPQRAIGEAVVENGRVVSATITDGGGYYTNAPIVTFGKPFSNGQPAQAFAGLSQGGVSEIIVSDGGYFYLNPPSITVQEPSGNFLIGGRLSNTESIMGERSLEYHTKNRFYTLRRLGDTSNTTFDFFIKPASNNASGVVFETTDHSITCNNGILEIDSVASNGDAITTDSWTYVMFLSNTSVIQMRQDEVLVAQTDVTSTFINNTLTIGNRQGNNFVGFYDAIRIRDGIANTFGTPLTNIRAATVSVNMDASSIDSIDVVDGGGYYTEAPEVTITEPTDYRRTANASVTINSNTVVTAVDVVDGGFFYVNTPNVEISAPDIYDTVNYRYGTQSISLSANQFVTIPTYQTEYGQIHVYLAPELATPNNQITNTTEYFEVDFEGSNTGFEDINDLPSPQFLLNPYADPDSTPNQLEGIEQNPTLDLYRGGTYTFVLDLVANATPLWIKSAPVSDNTTSVYADGVANNGTATGNLVFTIPNDAPDTLYYVSGVVSSMVGTINVLDVQIPNNEVTLLSTDDWTLIADSADSQYSYKFVTPEANLTHPSWIVGDQNLYGFDELTVQTIDDSGDKTIIVRVNGFSNTEVLTGDFKTSNGTISFGSARANTRYDAVLVSAWSNTEIAPLPTTGALPLVGEYFVWGNTEIFYSNVFSSDTTATANATVVDGAVDSFTITYEGFGYLTTPTATVANVVANTYYSANAYATIANGQVTSIVVTNTGVGYATTPTVTVANAVFNEFTANTTYSNAIYKNSFEYITAKGEAIISSNGIVIGVTVTDSGFGYEVPPTITFETPNTALYITASGNTEISNGQVVAINITNTGFGYTQGNGQMVVNPPIYNTAEASATLNANGQVVSIEITDAGQGYTTIPKIFITGDPIAGSLQSESGEFFLTEEANTAGITSQDGYAQNEVFQTVIETPVTTTPNEDTNFIDFSERNPFSEGGEW